MRMTIGPLMVLACDAALTEQPSEKKLRELRALPTPSANPRGTRRIGRVRQNPERMTMSSSGRVSSGAIARAAGWVGCFLILLASARVESQAPIASAVIRGKSGAGEMAPVTGSDPAASSLEAYLVRVRQDNKAAQTTPGAIWTDTGRLTRMSTDVRAMRPHDLISVVVSESLAASTDGTVKGSRASNATSGISGLIGALHAGNALQNLLSANASSGLNAQGASATNSSLTTTFGGQVVEVLPNGMLVIEAARQVEFSQQTETIMLRGLVRPEDISQQNQVLSTAISSMELQVRGKGIVNDSTHRQNALVRFLQWALVF